MDDAFAVGEAFETEFPFTAESITQIATMLGDTNPAHHTIDPRYGAVIACGGHIAGLVMSFGAAQITNRVPSLGRTWSIRFRLPILAGDTMHFVWRVTSLQPHRRGILLTLEGAGTVRRGNETRVVTTAEGDAVLLAE